MRVSIFITFTVSALAFPAATIDLLDIRSTDRAVGCPYAAQNLKHKRQARVDAKFDPIEQKVDVSGKYSFVPPRSSDKRGPCPGLNAMANHGYISRNGITTFHEAVEACYKVFGMSPDLGTLLSIVATIMDGDPFTQRWSIGGAMGFALPPLLSAPQGLSGSHHKFESDASPTRADFYLNNGDATSLNLTLFKQLYKLQPEGSPKANYDYDTLIEHRAARRQNSVSTNPHFFIAVFSGFLGSSAAFSFIPGLMSNHSTAAPEGVLNHEVLKSFYSVSGRGEALVYRKGYERIPDNWYKRNIPYDLAKFQSDFEYAGLKHPEFFSIGGNTGKVNSFAGLDPTDLTGGVYNLKNLHEGNNYYCFVFQATRQIIPDVFQGIADDLARVFQLWNTQVGPIMDAWGCPQLTKYNRDVFGKYPGSHD